MENEGPPPIESARCATTAPSEGARRAVIDIGTNSIKLLVADVAGRAVLPLLEKSKQTRLGRGFYQTHQLQPEAVAGTAAAVAQFAVMARDWNAETVRVIATSAARDAANPDDLTRAIEQAAGLPVEIISGEQEADWVFHGVTSDPEMAGRSLLILDVGGGSTEFILGEAGVQRYRHSYKLGSVRLLERLHLDDPPGNEALTQCRLEVGRFIRGTVTPALLPELRSCRQPVHLVGTGGTATILARMEAGMTEFHREQIEGIPLTLAALQKQSGRLWNLTLDQRRQVAGLPPKRADVILPGAVIYEAIVEHLGFPELRVSTRGLRYAALMDQATH